MKNIHAYCMDLTFEESDNGNSARGHFVFTSDQDMIVNGVETNTLDLTIVGEWERSGFFDAVQQLAEYLEEPSATTGEKEATALLAAGFGAPFMKFSMGEAGVPSGIASIDVETFLIWGKKHGVGSEMLIHLVESIWAARAKISKTSQEEVDVVDPSPASKDTILRAIGVISQFHNSNIDKRLITRDKTVLASPVGELVMHIDKTDEGVVYISAPALHDWLDSHVDDPDGVLDVLLKADRLYNVGHMSLGGGLYAFFPQTCYAMHLNEVDDFS